MRLVCRQRRTTKTWRSRKKGQPANPTTADSLPRKKYEDTLVQIIENMTPYVLFLFLLTDVISFWMIFRGFKIRSRDYYVKHYDTMKTWIGELTEPFRFEFLVIIYTLHHEVWQDELKSNLSPVGVPLFFKNAQNRREQEHFGPCINHVSYANSALVSTTKEKMPQRLPTV